MKVTQMPPVHASILVAKGGNTANGVDVIRGDTLHLYLQNLPMV